MAYGLGGSGSGVVRTTGNQTITGSLTVVSDGTTTPTVNIRGLTTDPLKQLFQIFDGFGNPIEATNNAGGDAVFGDRRSAYRPGDIFNADWQVMTAVNDNVATNAAGFRLGHGTSQGVAFFIGTGAPTAANPVTTGMPPNGSFYFRTDGGALTTTYQARAGAWVAIL